MTFRKGPIEGQPDFCLELMFAGRSIWNRGCGRDGRGYGGRLRDRFVVRLVRPFVLRGDGTGVRWDTVGKVIAYEAKADVQTERRLKFS